MSVIDHKGNEFSSYRAMAKAYGVEYTRFIQRIRKLGWTLERALTEPFDHNKKSLVYKGITYRTIDELAKAVNMLPGTLSTRLRSGMSIDEAIEEPLRIIRKDVEYNGVKRKRGDLCAEHNIDTTTFNRRLSTGRYTVEEALSDVDYNKKSVTDFLGIKYASITDMCLAHEIDPTLYNDRIKSGWSNRDALTVPSRCVNNRRTVTDHKGNKYDTISEMCRAYGMSNTTYTHRITRGWTQEKALETPVKGRGNGS